VQAELSAAPVHYRDGRGDWQPIDTTVRASARPGLHLTEYAKDGRLARPYGNSTLTIQNIMDAAKPVLDPGGVPGALRWDVPGSMNGSTGVWELVVDPRTKTILHFLFKSGR
jgi:hypothetical protein